MKKKILSILLAVVMMVSVLPMSAISAYAIAYTGTRAVESSKVAKADTFDKGTNIYKNNSKSNVYIYIDNVLEKNLSSNGSSSKYDIPRCIKITNVSTTSGYIMIKAETNCSFNEATCTAPKTCPKCGYTDGEALGHSWVDANCTTPKTCSRCSTTTGDPLGHDYSVYQSVKTAETCTTNRVENYKCSKCTSTTTKTISNTKLGHSYTKQGSKVSDATVDRPAVYNKQCERCTETSGTMEIGDKLPSMKVSYVDPITNETVDLGEATNDNAEEAVNTLMKTPMQKENNIFLGWVDENEDAINKNATRFDALTNIHANFLGLGYMQKDMNDEKLVDGYMTFGLAGVQIREDRTQEHSEYGDDLHEGETYGGLRFVASFADSVFNSLDVIEYGFVVATKDNAKANATASGDAANYVIKNGDKGVRRINCMGTADHRRFYDNYRLFTMVIDYQENPELKGTEFVARPYIVYCDNNGVNRIYYGSYDGTVTYGGCSTSYNNAFAM